MTKIHHYMMALTIMTIITMTITIIVIKMKKWLTSKRMISPYHVPIPTGVPGHHVVSSVEVVSLTDTEQLSRELRNSAVTQTRPNLALGHHVPIKFIEETRLY